MAYTDWSNHLRYIPRIKELNILEFGLGLGTPELTKRFKTVYSLEISDSDEWFNTAKDAVKDFPNWDGELILAKSVIEKHEKYAQSNFTDERDTQELEDLLEESKSRINYSDYEFFFVDAGVYFRGEIVNFCFQFNPQYIMIHDANGMHGYGYDLCVYMQQGEWRANDPRYSFKIFDRVAQIEEGTGLFTRNDT